MEVELKHPSFYDPPRQYCLLRASSSHPKPQGFMASARAQPISLISSTFIEFEELKKREVKATKRKNEKRKLENLSLKEKSLP